MCLKHWGGIDIYYKKEEGRFLLQIKGKNTMFYWALQYGLYIEVLKPKDLRNRFK